MNDEEFKNRTDNNWDEPRIKSRGRVLTGVVIFFIGVLLLMKTAHIIAFPSWFFSWPMIFIAIGLITGIKHGFRGGIWLVFLALGGIFLANKLDPSLQTERYVWPIVLIAIGLVFILRPRSHQRWHKWRQQQCRDNWGQTTGTQVSAAPTEQGPGDFDRRDFIDITAVFGGVKKNVLSKNFKGGDITSFMGGSEIDLTQADFNGTIKIDATNIFGGTKLIVPPTWDVQNDITAIFGGVDDKRQVAGVTMDPNKTLVLDGTCMFGGVEIRSY